MYLLFFLAQIWSMATMFVKSKPSEAVIIPVLMGIRQKNIAFIVDTSEAMSAMLGALKELLIQTLLAKASLRDSLFNIISCSYKVCRVCRVRVCRVITLLSVQRDQICYDLHNYMQSYGGLVFYIIFYIHFVVDVTEKPISFSCKLMWCPFDRSPQVIVRITEGIIQRLSFSWLPLPQYISLSVCWVYECLHFISPR